MTGGSNAGSGSQLARDSVIIPGVSFRKFRLKDQGGAFVQGQTVVNVAGLIAIGSASGELSLISAVVSAFQGGAQQIIAVPEFFDVDGQIVRICSRQSIGSVAVGSPACKFGLYSSGTLRSGNNQGSPYPDQLLAQTADFSFLGPADKTFDGLLANPIVVPAGTMVWFVYVMNAQAVTNDPGMMAVRRYAFPPIHGITWNTTLPTLVAQDAVTFSHGWRHAMVYTGTETLPLIYPQTAPARLNAGAHNGIANTPAICYGWQPL